MEQKQEGEWQGSNFVHVKESAFLSNAALRVWDFSEIQMTQEGGLSSHTRIWRLRSNIQRKEHSAMTLKADVDLKEEGTLVTRTCRF